MNDAFLEYRQRYEALNRELADLDLKQESIEKKRVYLRKELKNLETWLKSEGVELTPSPETASLQESLTLADDIRAILKLQYPRALRPNAIKAEINDLGRDLGKYSNPQATIHMVLKRMAQSASGGVSESRDSDGKQVYRYEPKRSPESKS